MTETITAFDIVGLLETGIDIQEILRETAKAGNSSDFIHALNTTAWTKGMAKVDKQAGITQASLNKSLAATGNPQFDTIAKIVKALSCKLVVS